MGGALRLTVTSNLAPLHQWIRSRVASANVSLPLGGRPGARERRCLTRFVECLAHLADEYVQTERPLHNDSSAIAASAARPHPVMLEPAIPYLAYNHCRARQSRARQDIPIIDVSLCKADVVRAESLPAAAASIAYEIQVVRSAAAISGKRGRCGDVVAIGTGLST